MTSRLSQILPGLYGWRSGLNGSQQPVNSYLWNAPSGTILIDPAADFTADVLQQIGAPEVTDIFITHLQAEHVAGCGNFSSARLHVPAGDESLCQGLQAYIARDMTWMPPWEWETRGNYQGHLAGARNERLPQEPLYFHRTLNDGDEIGGVRVLSTPGHGKNAIALLAEVAGHRVAFCGDLICGDGQLWNWFDCDWDYGLEGGQRALQSSALRLQQENLDLLLSSHSAPIHAPKAALAKLTTRIEAVLSDPNLHDAAPLNFPETDSPAHGWRELLPNLHQWKTGNCAVLISQTGNALMIDDGLCHWSPLAERAAHHREVIADLKSTLQIKKIEWVIPTHYHGDHIENIPELMELEDTGVLCLDVVSEVLERPEAFNLCCPLPWYGTDTDCIPVERKVPDGTRWRWREYELEIFHLGGQTWYHAGIAVTIENKRVLFVGDAILGWNTQPEPILCFNDNDPQTRGWLYSLEKMKARNPDLLVCGHGSAILNPMPLLEAKITAWQQRLEQFQNLSAREDLRFFFDPFYSN